MKIYFQVTFSLPLPSSLINSLLLSKSNIGTISQVKSFISLVIHANIKYYFHVGHDIRLGVQQSHHLEYIILPNLHDMNDM